VSGVYSMTGPTYSGLSKLDLLDSAMSQPLSITSTLFEEGKGGALESFGLGTLLRRGSLPEEAPVQDGVDQNGNAIVGTGDVYVPPDVGMRDALMGTWGDTPAQLEQRRQVAGALTEDQYKQSPSFRKDIPYDPGMTETRAAALAEMDDVKKVREFYAQKRPLAAFLGGMAGQALDPINYVPVGGPLVKAAAIGRFGRIGGEALAAGLDAAANTALFGIGTADARAALGDDVSWQALISQIATAGLIGSAFGTVAGAIGRRADARVSEAEQRLSTIKTTQEARIALNEGIDAIVRGEDVNLSPNATEPLRRVADEITAYHGSPHDFSAFATENIGSGEGAQAYGRGLYFAENADIAKSYQRKLGVDAMLADNPQAGSIVRDLLDANGGDFAKALKQLDREFESSIPGTDNMRNPVYADAHKFLSQQQPGNLYEVRIAASKDHLLDWDKPLSEQSPYVQDALRKQMGEANFEQFANKTGGDYVEYGLGNGHVGALMDAGIPGIKYLDASSREAGNGSHNIVVFDQNRVRIARKNDQPVAADTTKAAPEPPPDGIKQAAASIAKPEDAKALAAQYGVDANTGAFKEEAEIAQLADEGRLTEQDVATMTQAHADYEVADAYAEAIKSVASCLV
jgi:hypothetical protein